MMNKGIPENEVVARGDLDSLFKNRDRLLHLSKVRVGAPQAAKGVALAAPIVDLLLSPPGTPGPAGELLQFGKTLPWL